HAIAHAVAPTASRYEIRRLIHVLHAPRHRDIDVAEGDLLRSGDDGLRSRAADPIDGESWGDDREPGVDGSLAGGIHLGAGLDDVAHDDRFHIIGANVRARDRSGDCYRTESGSRNVLERASKGADGRPNRLRENERPLRCHGKPPESKVKSRRCMPPTGSPVIQRDSLEARNLAEPAERRIRGELLLEVCTDDARRMQPFGLDAAGCDRVHADIARACSAASTRVTVSSAPFCALSFMKAKDTRTYDSRNSAKGINRRTPNPRSNS